jgi:hypothetical protein
MTIMTTMMISFIGKRERKVSLEKRETNWENE